MSSIDNLPVQTVAICGINYDDSVYPPLENVPKKFAIVKRNEWTVNKADIIIAYVEHDWGGAARTLKYAVRKKKDIVNLALVE